MKEIAHQYGENIFQVLNQRFSDYTSDYPVKVKSFPKFLQTPLLTRPVAQDGTIMSEDEKEVLCHLLVYSNQDAPFDVISEIKENYTTESLDKFCLDIFHSWIDKKSPTKEAWMMNSRSVAKLMQIKQKIRGEQPVPVPEPVMIDNKPAGKAFDELNANMVQS